MVLIQALDEGRAKLGRRIPITLTAAGGQAPLKRTAVGPAFDQAPAALSANQARSGKGIVFCRRRIGHPRVSRGSAGRGRRRQLGESRAGVAIPCRRSEFYRGVLVSVAINRQIEQ